MVRSFIGNSPIKSGTKMNTRGIYLSVAQDFSKTPGARFKEEGPFSAEEFLEEYVYPKFDEALEKGEKLTIDLDGVEGYATSFLQGIFGNLAHRHGANKVRATVEIISTDDPLLNEYVARYIEDAHAVTSQKSLV